MKNSRHHVAGPAAHLSPPEYEGTFSSKDNPSKPVLKYEYISMVLKWLVVSYVGRPTSNFKQKTGFLWSVVLTQTHACGKGYLGFFLL